MNWDDVRGGKISEVEHEDCVREGPATPPWCRTSKASERVTLGWDCFFFLRRRDDGGSSPVTPILTPSHSYRIPSSKRPRLLIAFSDTGRALGQVGRGNDAHSSGTRHTLLTHSLFGLNKIEETIFLINIYIYKIIKKMTPLNMCVNT